MWKRLQGHGRDKEKQIGNPVLLETTYDEDRLKHIPNVSAAQNAAYQPNDSFQNSQAHDNHLVSQYNQHNRASEVPTVSSIYSQPSPDPRYNYGSGRHMNGVDISPPSSPDSDQYHDPTVPRRFRSMRDVSPVDETRGRFNYSARAPSNIPVLRKAPPSLRDQEQPSAPAQKFWGGKVAPNSKVRWDEYSGEPTSSNAGKSSSVTPGSFAISARSLQPERLSGQNISLSGTDVPLAQRASRFGSKPPPIETKPRVEPWSRAVGRSQIAKPLEDKPSDEPIHFTQKTESARPPQPIQDDSEEFNTIQDPVKPIVPLKAGRNSSSPRNFTSPTSPHRYQQPGPNSYPSPTTPTNKPSIISSSNGPVITRNELAHPPSNVPAETLQETPESIKSRDKVQDSRFSWTTYNSTTTYEHSPPPSPPPPLPTSISAEPLPAAPTVLNHKDSTPAAVSRKPIGESTAKIMQPKTRASSDPASPRPESTFSTSTNKALPRPPAEFAATDHIEILSSQMEDLRIRRNNVYRLLNDLNNMAPPNPMITDFRRMRLVEQRKKDFENELADIRVEEHDVGLKLHRAFRKRERLDPNGGSSALWVRRVTR